MTRKFKNVAQFPFFEMTTIVGVKTNFKDDAVVLAADSQATSENIPERTFDIYFLHEPNQSKLYNVDSGIIGLSGDGSEFPEGFHSYLRGERSYNEYLEYLGGDEESNIENGLPFVMGINYAMLLEKIDKLRRRRKNLSQSESAIKALITEKKEPKDEFEEFLANFFNGFGDDLKNPLARAADINRRYFFEFDMLNRYASVRNLEDEWGSHLLFAVNEPEIGLYRCDSHGIVYSGSSDGGLEYETIGSGKKWVHHYLGYEKYLEDKLLKGFNPEKVDLEAAKNLALRLVEYAIEKDKYSGGIIDLAVVKEGDIKHYGPEIKKSIKESKHGIYGSIK